MKLNKRDRTALYRIVASLERGRSYLLAPEIAVARRTSDATTTLHYTRADGGALYEVDKTIGSDLAVMWTGIEDLKRLIDG